MKIQDVYKQMGMANMPHPIPRNVWPDTRMKPAMLVFFTPALWMKQLMKRLARKHAQGIRPHCVSFTFMMLVYLGLASISFTSNAETYAIIESKPIGELWLNPGFYSDHFQKDKGLNNNNYGLGGEYRYSTVNSVTLGLINNSDRKTSHYVGWYWQPLGLGLVRFGAVFGAMDGYPNMLNGGWFPALIPVASIEYKSIGANLMFVPSYKDRLYGAVSLQLKLKVF